MLAAEQRFHKIEVGHPITYAYFLAALSVLYSLYYIVTYFVLYVPIYCCIYTVIVYS